MEIDPNKISKILQAKPAPKSLSSELKSMKQELRTEGDIELWRVMRRLGADIREDRDAMGLIMDLSRIYSNGLGILAPLGKRFVKKHNKDLVYTIRALQTPEGLDWIRRDGNIEIVLQKLREALEK